MKTHAFLIVAHKYPQLLANLVRQLDAEQAFFFVHVDAKSVDFMAHEQMSKLIEKHNVWFLSPRTPLFWGGFSQIKVTLSLIEIALQYGQFDYYHLISAQDFMTQTKEQFYRFFESNDRSFLELDDSDRQYPQRMEYYYLNDWIDLPNASYWTQCLNQKFNAFQSKFRSLFLRKQLPTPLFKGASWWSLRDQELHEIVNYLAAHPEYVDRFRATQCADELFIQSILFNLSDWKERINPFSLRYVDWTPLSPGDRLPHILTIRHEEPIRQSNALFARKVDPHESRELLEKFGIYV